MLSGHAATSKPTRHILSGWSSMIFGLIALASQIVAGETNNPSSNDLGVANVKSNDWKEAISNFTKAIHSNPQKALAYEYRGGAYFANGELDNAIKDYTHVVQLDTTNSTNYCNRGSAYSAKREFDKAIQDFNECLRLNPIEAYAYKGRAASYSAKAEFETAIKDWDEGLRLSPNDTQALAMRGWAYFMTSKFDKAVQDYNEAIRLDPKNDKAYNNLGWLRATCPVAEMRNGKEAVELATKACELTNWKRWEWIDTLAAAFAEAGDFENAVKYEKQVMGMNGVTASDRPELQRCLSLYEKKQPNHEGQKQ